MTWDKLKNFLIILFLSINVFLIICTISVNNNDKLSDNTIDYTVSLLNKGNIKIDKKIIPNKKLYFLGAEFKPITESDIRADNISNITSDGNCLIKFTIKNAKLYTKNPSDILRQIGLKKNTFKIVTNKTSGDTRHIYASEIYNKLKVYNAYIDIKINKNGIAQIELKWYNNVDRVKTKANNNTIYASSVLIDFMNNPMRNDTSKNIKNFSYGYYIPTIDSNDNVQTITSIPAYCIQTDDSMKYYYNAFDGNYLQ